MASLRLDNITKTFASPALTAVDRLTLEIKSGELLVLLGPSGSGKTTLLRLIAGLERPTEGSISLDDKIISNLPPQVRPVGMAFQYPALLPQLTVEENIGLGPKLRRVPGSDLLERVRELATLLDLDHLLRRLPETLSGGEQQRVSLARALANQPSVLLLDEPLANLDAPGRTSLREAIRKVQQQLRLTTVYVTHDQVEAAAVSDRVAVLNRGRLEQAATARELFRDPENLFVARFFGPDEPNIIEGELSDRRFHARDNSWSVPASIGTNTPAFCLIRPASIRPGNGISATIRSLQQTGWNTIALLETGGLKLRAVLEPSLQLQVGDPFTFDLPDDEIFYFDPSGRRIRN